MKRRKNPGGERDPMRGAAGGAWGAFGSLAFYLQGGKRLPFHGHEEGREPGPRPAFYPLSVRCGVWFVSERSTASDRHVTDTEDDRWQTTPTFLTTATATGSA
jgi:hypothetical protein